MKQTKLHITYLLLAALAVAGCSNENDPSINPADQPDAVELGIIAGVALTKSAINSGSQTGADANTTMKYVAVYAVGTGSSYTSSNSNNYALYTRTSNAATWTNEGSSKIMLTSEKATVYAYHPAYQPDATTKAMATTTPLTVTNFADTSTIPISVFEGADSGDDSTIPADVNNADKSLSGSTWEANTNKGKIASAAGEVDYMWATLVPNKSNGKGTTGTTDATAKQAALEMNHAMSMVSFRIYNDGTYKNTGKLTKIALSNKSGNVLTKGTTPTMKVADGTVNPGTADAAAKATYKRLIGTSGFTLKKNGDANISTDAQAKDASPKFSILVMPETTASNKQTIEAAFTIDDAVYTVALPNDGTSKWEKGNNYLYTVKLSGTALEITSVTVQAWTDKDGSTGELPIN